MNFAHAQLEIKLSLVQYINAHSLTGTASCATFQGTYMSRSNIFVILAHLEYFYCAGTYNVLRVSAVSSFVRVYIYIHIYSYNRIFGTLSQVLIYSTSMLVAWRWLRHS
jgi:hypothetical protein